MALSEKLYALRRESGLSQEQLAERLNVSRQAVSKWESGQAMPESEKLIGISDYFKVSLDYLLKEDGERQAPSEESGPPRTENRTGWLLGSVSCIGGALGLAVWGVLSLLHPAAAGQLSEASTIRIDGNGIFLLLCVGAVVSGAVLLLRSAKRK